MVLILSGPGAAVTAPGFFLFSFFRDVLFSTLVKRALPIAEIGAS